MQIEQGSRMKSSLHRSTLSPEGGGGPGTLLPMSSYVVVHRIEPQTLCSRARKLFHNNGVPLLLSEERENP